MLRPLTWMVALLCATKGKRCWYPAACRTVMPSVIHYTDQYANNRAEVSQASNGLAIPKDLLVGQDALGRA